VVRDGVVAGPGTESPPLAVSGLAHARIAAASARRTSAIVTRLQRLDRPRPDDVRAIVAEVSALIDRLPRGTHLA
jgi:hypothetical protein